MAPMKKPTPQTLPEFAQTMSLDAAADKLGVSRPELRRQLGNGQLPFVQVRGHIRVPKEAVEMAKESAF